VSETIRCGNCDMLLYFGEELKRRLYMRAIPSEETVLGFYDDKCPRCGTALSVDSVNVVIEGRVKHGS
jgi:phage FluMu protein Com